MQNKLKSPLVLKRSISYPMLVSNSLSLSLSLSAAICLSHFTHDSISLSALVSYLPPCYTILTFCVNYQMLPPSLLTYTLCNTKLQKLILILRNKVSLSNGYKGRYILEPPDQCSSTVFFRAVT